MSRPASAGPPRANVVMIPMFDAAGRNFEMACIPLRAFPMWLATVDADRDKPEAVGRETAGTSWPCYRTVRLTGGNPGTGVVVSAARTVASA
jgi:hypothetical protein